MALTSIVTKPSTQLVWEYLQDEESNAAIRRCKTQSELRAHADSKYVYTDAQWENLLGLHSLTHK